MVESRLPETDNDRRDDLAARAMQGWLASYTGDQAHPAALRGDGSVEQRHAEAVERCEGIAEMSYVMADAMLTVRGRAK
jgi:hypothetical protein